MDHPRLTAWPLGERANPSNPYAQLHVSRRETSHLHGQANLGSPYEPLHVPPEPRSTFWKSIRRQWHMTTDAKFLGSSSNRRAHWYVFLPFLGVMKLASDYLSGGFENTSWALWSELLLPIISLALGRLPARYLGSDVAISVLHSVYMWLWLCLFAAPQVDCIETFFALFLFVLGLHSFAIVGFGVSCSLIRCWRHEFFFGILGLFGCIVVAIVAWYASVKEAVWLFELDSKKRAIERFLDNTSYGFCTVDPTTGTVQAASQKLQNTMGDEELIGKTLTDLIARGTGRQPVDAVRNAMGNSALDGEEGKPFSFTYQIKRISPYSGMTMCNTFSAQVIPYALSLDSVNLLIVFGGLQSEGGMTSTTAVEGTKIDAAVQTDESFTSSSSMTFESGGSGGAGVTGKKNTISTSSMSQKDTEMRPLSRKDPATAGAFHVDPEMRPMLGQHRLTPASSCLQSLHWLLKHFNLPKSHDACCPLHGTTELVISLLQSSRSDSCQPLWSPNVDWQCNCCSGMNSNVFNKCMLCGTQTSETESAASTDPASQREDFIALVSMDASSQKEGRISL